MGSLTIDLPVDLERHLSQEAAKRGQTPAEYARAVLAECLHSIAPKDAPDGTASLLADGLPPSSPAELLALAAEQGVKPVERFEDLLGEPWPEDEDGEPFDVDAFLKARRQWQQEGGLEFPSDEAGRA